MLAHRSAARSTSTETVLSALADSFADREQRAQLVAAHRLFSGLTQMVRLCLTGPLDPDDVPPGLADLLLGTTDLPDWKVLEAHVRDTAAAVRALFEALLGDGGRKD